MTDFDYAARIREHGLNTYFVAEGDRDYHIRTVAAVPANPTCNCYSVAKAFTVTAVGLLYDRGLLHPNDLVTEILSDFLPASLDPRWHSVTVDHLLLHRVGFDRGLLDIDVEDASAYPTTDYLRIVLSQRLVHEPGTVGQYTDAAYYLLSRIVAKRASMDLAAFLRPTLMEVMRFREMAWSTCPQGYSMGATGLYLRTEDVVKLGILYLNGGVWKGTRILSEEWVRLVLERGYEFKAIGDGWYAKGGMRGQALAFHPKRGLAVAWHSYEGKIPYATMLPPDKT